MTLLALAFLGWFLPACYTQAAMCQRAMMTWSFDGLLPRRLAAVSPTRHTPAAAIVATALLSIPLAVWICYSDNFFQYFAIAAVSAYPSLVLVGITATLIKRRRPDLYKGSSAEWRLGGIEVLPIFGVHLQPRRCGRDRAAVRLPHGGRPAVHDRDRHLPRGDVRRRRDLVGHRAVDAPQARASTSTSRTRRSRPNEVRTSRIQR